MSVLDLQATPALSTKDMPYVTFESRDEEDVLESKKQGRMIRRDQVYARITSPGTRDVHYEKMPRWFDKLEIEVRAGRVMQEWVDRWRLLYDRYCKGQELPTDGTPIRGWTMLSKAQQENLISANILTVEDLATMHQEGLQRVGMGALELRRRAEAWLLQNQSSEAGAMKIKDLQRENDTLKETLQQLTEKVEALSRNAEAKAKR